MKSDKMKSHYDLQATGDKLQEGNAVWQYIHNEREVLVPN